MAHLGVYYALNKNGIRIFSVYKAEVSSGRARRPLPFGGGKGGLWWGGLGPPMAGGGENRFSETLGPAPRRILCQPQPPNPRALPTPLRALPGGGIQGLLGPQQGMCVCTRLDPRVCSRPSALPVSVSPCPVAWRIPPLPAVCPPAGPLCLPPLAPHLVPRQPWTPVSPALTQLGGLGQVELCVSKLHFFCRKTVMLVEFLKELDELHTLKCSVWAPGHWAFRKCWHCPCLAGV